MKLDKNKLVLSSGREIRCLGLKVGLSLSDSPVGWRMTTGFDDVIHTRADGSWHEDALSHEEAREIASRMIEAWTHYKNSIPD